MSESFERDSMQYDVVIVGAGPSGLATAIKLKQLAEKAEREKTEQVMKDTIAEYEPFVANVPEEVAPPVEEISEQPQQDEKVLSLSFKVYGTKSQLKDFALTVKQLINERGLRYE